MHIDFFFDKLIPQIDVLNAFRKVVANNNETINFLDIAAEDNKAYTYLLEYQIYENTNLCLSLTLCGYSGEKEWNNKQAAIFEIAKKLSKETNNNVYFLATIDSPFEIIKISPTGEIYGGMEIEADDDRGIDFEYVKKITPREIKKLQSTLLKAELEERQFELQTQMEYSFK